MLEVVKVLMGMRTVVRMLGEEEANKGDTLMVVKVIK